VKKRAVFQQFHPQNMRIAFQFTVVTRMPVDEFPAIFREIAWQQLAKTGAG
jgi:hypothetical protein